MELRETGMESEAAGPWCLELILRSEAGRTAKPLEVIEATLGLKGEALLRSRVTKVE